MTPRTKAALLSALLFPGLGQALVLKRPRRALLFVVPAVVALFWLLGSALSVANRIAEQIVTGRLALAPVAIAQQIEAANASGASGEAAAAVLIVAWIASILDALLLR